MKKWVTAGVLSMVMTVSVIAALPKSMSGKVVKVYDGDTITVLIDGKEEKFRLLGIDTPEKSYTKILNDLDKISKYLPEAEAKKVQDAKKILFPYGNKVAKLGHEAQEYLASLILDKEVTLSHDAIAGDSDRFGRDLVFVTYKRTDINDTMVAAGWAVADIRFECSRLEKYVASEKQAHKFKKGMWK